jgi:protein-disulfide isomerase
MRNLFKTVLFATFTFMAPLSVAAAQAAEAAPVAPAMNLVGVSKSAPAQVEGGVPDMYMGSDKAPITIIEYASLTCTHCADFHMHTLPLLKKTYIDTGHVKYIWRHFILSGPDMAASVIARCAGPSRFFPMIDMFYTRMPEWIAPWQGLKPPQDATLKSVALMAGMDKFVRPTGLSSEKVSACLADENLQRAIMTTRQDGAQKYDIKGTPTIIINGKVFSGDHSFESINAEIKKLL